MKLAPKLVIFDVDGVLVPGGRLDRGARPDCRVAARVRWRRAELPRKHRAQIGHAAVLGGCAVHLRLALESDTLPEHLEHSDCAMAGG